MKHTVKTHGGSISGTQKYRPASRLVGGALVLSMLAGCTSFTKTPATPQVVGQLRGQAVSQVVAEPKFWFLTGEDGLKFAVVSTFTGGLFGGAVMNNSATTKGKEISELGGLSDPGRKVARVLADRMKSELQIQSLGPLGMSASEDVNQILGAAPTEAAYVLDVRTGAWGGVYLPTQWNRYRLMYSLKARLIERQSKKVLVEGYCDYTNGTEAKPPSYEEVIAERAALLRERMDAYAQECAQEVWAQMFPTASLIAPALPGQKPAQETVTAAALPAPKVPQSVVAAPAVGAAVSPSTGLPASTVAAASEAVPSNANPGFQLSPQATERYQVYLSKPKPKAFAIGENGESWMAWGESLNPLVTETVPQRALRGCQERSRTPCVLYAKDDKIVHGSTAAGQR